MVVIFDEKNIEMSYNALVCQHKQKPLPWRHVTLYRILYSLDIVVTCP